MSVHQKDASENADGSSVHSRPGLEAAQRPLSIAGVTWVIYIRAAELGRRGERKTPCTHTRQTLRSVRTAQGRAVPGVRTARPGPRVHSGSCRTCGRLAHGSDLEVLGAAEAS